MAFMRLAKNSWPMNNIKAISALFFAQLMREMLTPQTFESFRALSLGTLARLDEAINVIVDVQCNRIPKAALEPVWSELEWSLNEEPVAKLLASRE